MHPAVPAHVRKHLKTKYHAVGFRNLALYGGLEETLAAFHARGIPTIVLKGAALADAVYANVGLRTMSDLDLLVSPDKVSVAINTLEALGYSHVPDEKKRAKEFVIRHDTKICFSKRGRVPVFLDLHWHTMSYPPLNRYLSIHMPTIWERAEPIQVGHEKALKLSPEDMVIHLCQHVAVNHCFLGLVFYRDISQVIEQAVSFDWDYVVERVREWGLGHATYYCLLLAKTLLEASVPEERLRALSPSPLHRVLFRLFLDPAAIIKSRPSIINEANRRFIHFLLVPRLSDAVGMLWFLLVPDKGWLKDRYDTQNLWAAYSRHAKNLLISSVAGFGKTCSALMRRLLPPS
jgi:hypothetical protein